MGDYTEIDGWVASGRVDFGFLPRAPRYSGLAGAWLGGQGSGGARWAAAGGEASVPVSALCEPFIVLERGQDDEIAPSSNARASRPTHAFPPGTTTPIMSMVEAAWASRSPPALSGKPYAIVQAARPGHLRTVRVVYREERCHERPSSVPVSGEGRAYAPLTNRLTANATSRSAIATRTMVPPGRSPR